MEYNRAIWGSRRGMLELDLILLPFVEQRYLGLPAGEQSLFEKLLTCEDQDLFAWFLQRQEPADADLKRIVEIVRTHHAT